MKELIEEKIKNIASVLEKCEQIIFKDLVSWDSLEGWLLGQSKSINGSLNTLILKDDRIKVFETVIPVNCTFPRHYHDFIEVIYIKKGRWGQLKAGDIVLYKEMQVHEIYNDGFEDLEILVIFSKNKFCGAQFN
jgi:quercetin dioxygenase-like cupin family protein